MMKRLIPCIVLLTPVLAAQSLPPVRPPAVPLVLHDPYFSLWSESDALTQSPTRHWTGIAQGLSAVARIDGAAFRCMGSWQRNPPEMKQKSLRVTPTRTIYVFEQAGVELTLTFLTPALPWDLDVLSRPVTYINFDARSADGKDHRVELYFDASSHIALNVPEQRVHWSRIKMPELDVLRAGSAAQEILVKSGDDLRIDWGYLYLATRADPAASTAIANQRARDGFASGAPWPETDDTEPPLQTSRNQLLLAARFDLGTVGSSPVKRQVLLAYDDLFSIQHLHRNLRPWWRRKGATATDLLRVAAAEYPALEERCRRFDEELTADLVKAGGAKYAQIAILAYRQTLAAHKLVAELDGTPLFFSKENNSNGCIGTVDVTYPSAPLPLLFNPTLLKGMLSFIFDYANLPRWPWPFAPHDIGQYPLANGQVYGGGERTQDRQMPVEESGNMIILTAALAEVEGDASFAGKYWAPLSKWANYLREKGMDPENQLSTDDFAGHLARNTNLSLKAIVALGAYSKLAAKLGRAAEASEYQKLARDYAARWVAMAADGDHYTLAFDKPGTWSQKYNLVWDRILGLNLFSPEVARKEIAFYKTKQNRYGLPLDNRETYTKLDWIVWSATLAENREDFDALVDPVFRFLNETPDRVAMTDWYWTTDGKRRGFKARSVVGGVYIKMLADPEMWKKWAKRAN